MKTSLCLLTYNRSEIVEKSFLHNIANAGDKIDEIIWVDNGSSLHHYEYMKEFIHYTTHVRHVENKGVARGYNVAMALCNMDYIVITGCDMLLPVDWLKTFKEYHQNIPHTGISCIYSRHLSEVPERIRVPRVVVGGLPIVPAMPIERRMFKRSLLKEIGYFHEGFGLYGYDDIAWSNTAERVCKEKGLLTYVIPDIKAEHLGTDGVALYDGKDDRDYHTMKNIEARMPYKQELLTKLQGENWPAQFPF